MIDKTLIESSDKLMLSGDRFEMFWHDWYRILNSPMGGSVIRRENRKVTCEVLRMYLRSHCEIRYVCCNVDDKRHAEFVLAQFLEQPYRVTATAESLQVSALVLGEAAARAGVRPISDRFPNCYTQEDAERVAAEIQKMQLEERHGYLVPALS